MGRVVKARTKAPEKARTAVGKIALQGAKWRRGRKETKGADSIAVKRDEGTNRRTEKKGINTHYATKLGFLNLIHQ